MEAVNSFMNRVMVEDSQVTGSILPKRAAPAAFPASAFSVILQELGSQLLRLLQVSRKTWEATDAALCKGWWVSRDSLRSTPGLGAVSHVLPPGPHAFSWCEGSAGSPILRQKQELTIGAEDSFWNFTAVAKGERL